LVSACWNLAERALILGKISKRGNRYLRVLFVQAAWVVHVKVKQRAGITLNEGQTGNAPLNVEIGGQALPT
jgi:hypothetical protein